jgi:hypothetical protein
MSDLKNIKNIFSDFEMEYDPQDWKRLEKELPKTGKANNYFGKISGIISIVAIFVATIITVIVISQDSKIDNSVLSTSDNAAKEETVNNKINQNQVVEENTSLNSKREASENSLDLHKNKLVSNDGIDKEKPAEKLISLQEAKTAIPSKMDIENVSSNDLLTQEENDQSENQQNSGIKNSNLHISYKVEMVQECTPAKVIFSANNVPSGYDIYWDMGDGSSLKGNVVEHVYVKGGTFSPIASVVSDNFIIKKDEIMEISIKASSFIKINYESSENNYTFNSDLGGNTQILWSIDGNEFNYDNVNYTFSKSGKYKISLSVIDEAGCKTETSEVINVNPEPVYYMPNAFIPGRYGDVNSYFGPIGENLDFKSYKFTIVDLNGNIVFESQEVEKMWNGKINNTGADANAGYYLWEIKTIDWSGNIHSQKGKVNLIKE